MELQKKQSLRDAYEYRNFQAVLDYKDLVLNKWRDQSCIGETEFQTMRLTFEREYKIRGLEEFFETIYGEIYGD